MQEFDISNSYLTLNGTTFYGLSIRVEQHAHTFVSKNSFVRKIKLSHSDYIDDFTVVDLAKDVVDNSEPFASIQACKSHFSKSKKLKDHQSNQKNNSNVSIKDLVAIRVMVAVSHYPRGTNIINGIDEVRSSKQPPRRKSISSNMQIAQSFTNELLGSVPRSIQNQNDKTLSLVFKRKLSGLEIVDVQRIKPKSQQNEKKVPLY